MYDNSSLCQLFNVVIALAIIQQNPTDLTYGNKKKKKKNWQHGHIYYATDLCQVAFKSKILPLNSVT